MSDKPDINLHDLLPGIAARAGFGDLRGEWPSEDLSALAKAGATRWAVKKAFGGDEIASLELHLRYELISSASLATALVLTQRDSGVSIIEASENAALRDELMQKLVRGESFTTVGIAQLTTSRQFGAPALIATKVRDGWRLRGVVPWSTGADHSEFVVIGAAVDGATAGEQVLLALPTGIEGMKVQPSMQLVALRASHTSAIVCEDVIVSDHYLLKGPVPHVLAGRKQTVPIGQAFLAMGLCAGGINLIHAHGSSRGHGTASVFETQLRALRDDVLAACESPTPPSAGAGAQLRGRCNELAIRITHAAVAIYKGTGLLVEHPAQRLAREAMFLLVWSCPEPVVDCTVDLLAASH